jgi:ABC-2 type transport system permease protein
MSRFGVLIRREFWEHRGLWITPLAIAAVLIIGTVFLGEIQIDVGFAGPPGSVDLRPPPMALLMLGLSVPFYIATAILAVAYFLDCLYAERRDRSILFWKSMPVSDRLTVLSKFVAGLIVFPLGTYLVIALTSVAVGAALWLRARVGVAADALPGWDWATWLRVQSVLLYGLVAALLWYAPYAAYLMLVSVWARRSVYAWAFIPPVLLALLEHQLLGTYFFGRIVQRGFSELLRLAFHLNRQFDISIGEVMTRPVGGAGGGRLLLQPFDPRVLLGSPQLWIGLIVAALMLLAAIRLRRLRDDS